MLEKLFFVPTLFHVVGKFTNDSIVRLPIPNVDGSKLVLELLF